MTFTTNSQENTSVKWNDVVIDNTLEEKIKNILFSSLSETQKKQIGFCLLLEENTKERPIDSVRPKIELIDGMIG